VGIVPLIFNLSTGYNWLVSFTLRLIYIQGKKMLWEGGLSPRQPGRLKKKEKSPVIEIVILE
jgi:hypothetical protein